MLSPDKGKLPFLVCGELFILTVRPVLFTSAVDLLCLDCVQGHTPSGMSGRLRKIDADCFGWGTNCSYRNSLKVLCTLTPNQAQGGTWCWSLNPFVPLSSSGPSPLKDIFWGLGNGSDVYHFQAWPLNPPPYPLTIQWLQIHMDGVSLEATSGGGAVGTWCPWTTTKNKQTSLLYARRPRPATRLLLSRQETHFN